MSNLIEYDCNDISSNISKIRIATNGDSGAIKIKYKDSDTEYEYTGVGIDKIVDLERCYRKLKSKPYNGTAHSGNYLDRWSIGKFFNSNIGNVDEYKVKK